MQKPEVAVIEDFEAWLAGSQERAVERLDQMAEVEWRKRLGMAELERNLRNLRAERRELKRTIRDLLKQVKGSDSLRTRLVDELVAVMRAHGVDPATLDGQDDAQEEMEDGDGSEAGRRACGGGA